MKRLLALLLAFALVVSFVPATAFAQEDVPLVGNQPEEIPVQEPTELPTEETTEPPTEESAETTAPPAEEAETPAVVAEEESTADPYSGSLNDTVKWKFNTETGVLTISGTGAMPNVSYHNQAYAAYKNQITSVVVEEGITHVGAYSFTYSSAASISLPSTVTSIGGGAFNRCPIKSIELPAALKRIEGSTFYGTALEEIVIPEGVESIGSGAFSECRNLKSITIPSSLKKIEGHYTFEGCSSLSAVHISDMAAWCNIQYEDVDRYCVNPLHYAKHLYLNGELVTDVVVPEGVTELDGSFINCADLETVSLPEGLTTIGRDTFDSCPKLKAVLIPASVTSIEMEAFYECFMLGAVYYTGTKEQWDAITIGKTNYSLLDAALFCNHTTGLPKRVTVSGSFVTSGEASDVTYIKLLQDGKTKYETAVTGTSGVYTIEKVFPGTYTMEVTKTGCDTATYLITVDTADITQNVDIHVHIWADATCAAPRTCQVCGVTEGVALEHTEVIDEAVAPTCTTTGLTEGKHCSACEGILIKQNVVDALGHAEAIDEAVAPTCTATGLTEGKHCTVCEEVLVKQAAVDATGHDFADATCILPKTCKTCQEIQGEALGHSFTNYASNGDATKEADGTKTACCDRDGCEAADTVTDVGSRIVPISIDIVKLPVVLTYLEGKDALDVTGGQITLTYNNDTTEVLELTADMVTGFDNTKVGKQTLTVTCGGKTAAFEVEILAKTLVSAELTKLPDKLSYAVGREELDVTGGQLTLTYDNDTVEIAALTADMVTGFDNTQIGKQDLTVTYGGFTAAYQIEILNWYLVNVAVSKLPEKLGYLEGKDTLDLTGGQLTLTYNDNTTEVLDLTAEMVTGFDNTVVGPQTLTVTYEAFTASFEVEIVAKSLAGIEVTQIPAELLYRQGEKKLVNPDGKLTLYYNNDTTEEIAITAAMLSGYSATKTSTQTVTVTYAGFKTSFAAKVFYDLSEGSITASETLTYSGRALTPTVTVKSGTGGKLSKNSHYTMTLENNKEVGTATVTITGKGKYSGTITDTFRIVPGKASAPKVSYQSGVSALVKITAVKGAQWYDIYVDGAFNSRTEALSTVITGLKTNVSQKITVAAGATVEGVDYVGSISSYAKVTPKHKMDQTEVTLDQDTFVYTGSYLKPAVTVTGYQDEVLTEGEDYTLKYYENKNTGRANVLVTGKGAYTGSERAYFIINPKQVTGLEMSSYGTSTVTIRFDKAPSNSTKYYEVYVDGEYDGRTTGSTYTLRDLIPYEKHDVYVVGTKTVSSGTYKSEPSETIQVYIGPGKCASAPKVSYIDGVSANVSFKAVKDAQWYDIYVDGAFNSRTEALSTVITGLKTGVSQKITVRAVVINNGEEYVGLPSSAASVTPKHKMDQCTVTLAQEIYAYTGSAIKPAVTVKGYLGEELTEGVDYTLKYSENKNTGRGNVVITGKGGYTGSERVSFIINPMQVTGLQMSAYGTSSVTIRYNKASSNSTKYYNVYVDGVYHGRTTGNTYTIKNLPPYEKHAVYVVASKSVSSGTYESEPSETIQVYIGPGKCGAPKVTYLNGVSAQVSFPAVKDAQWYDIYVDGNWNSRFTETSGVIGNLKPNVTQRVTVKAGVTNNGEEFSGLASDATAVTPRHKLDQCAVTLAQDAFAYTGKAIRPEVIVTGYENAMLTEGVDYTLEYGENKNTGRGSVTVTGKDKYTGTMDVYFDICPMQVTGLQVSATTADSVTIRFDKASEYSTKYYQVYLDGAYLGYTTSNTYTIRDLEEHMEYDIYVVGTKTVNGVEYASQPSQTIAAVPAAPKVLDNSYENTHVNTGNQRKDIVAVALSQVGYYEGDAKKNDTKYGDWYNLPRQPWCAMFVSWCAQQADISQSILKKSSIATPRSHGFNIPYYDGEEYTPEPGDLFFTKTFSHVGIVTKVEGDIVYTVEGNTHPRAGIVEDDGPSDTNTADRESYACMVLRRYVKDCYFGVPNYKGADEDHTYERRYDTAHPHASYYECTTCGDQYYTGTNAHATDCEICMNCSCDTEAAGKYRVLDTGASRARVYSSHNTGSKVCGYLDDGEIVQVVAANSVWAHIIYANQAGFVLMSALEYYVPAPETVGMNSQEFYAGDTAVIQWPAVIEAWEYPVKVVRDKEVVFNGTITDTSLTLENLEKGTYRVWIYANDGTKTSPDSQFVLFKVQESPETTGENTLPAETQ